LKCAMAALTAFMSCGARAAAAHVRCSPSRGAGLSRRPAGCIQCVLGVSTFLGILVRTRNYNGSQFADPHAHKETAMVRNQLTHRSNRCSFTKTRPGRVSRIIRRFADTDGVTLHDAIYDGADRRAEENEETVE
jgi:hypothetical protein